MWIVDDPFARGSPACRYGHARYGLRIGIHIGHKLGWRWGCKSCTNIKSAIFPWNPKWPKMDSALGQSIHSQEKCQLPATGTIHTHFRMSHLCIMSEKSYVCEYRAMPCCFFTTGKCDKLEEKLMNKVKESRLKCWNQVQKKKQLL